MQITVSVFMKITYFDNERNKIPGRKTFIALEHSMVNYILVLPISRYGTEISDVEHKIIIHLARTRKQDCHKK